MDLSGLVVVIIFIGLIVLAIFYMQYKLAEFQTNPQAAVAMEGMDLIGGLLNRSKK